MEQKQQSNKRRGFKPGGGPNARLNVAKPKDAKGTLKRIWKYLAKEKGRMVLVVLLVILSSVGALVSGYLLRPVINSFLEPDGLSRVGLYLIAMLVLYLFSIAFTYLQSRVMMKTAQNTVTTIRRELFDHLQNLPLRYFDTNANGDIMSRFTNDMDYIGEALSNSVTQLISGTISFLGTFILMLVISPVLTAITLVVLPLIMLVATKIMKNSRKAFREQQSLLGEVNGYVEENTEGQKVVKVFNHQKTALLEFDEKNRRLCEAATRAQFLSGIMMPLMGSINTVNFALTASVGGLLATAGLLDLGGLGVFLQYAHSFSRPLNEITNQFNVIQSALAGAERVFAAMDEPTEPYETGTPLTEAVHGDVRFENVTFGYEPEKPVLKNITLYAKPGQKIALVGSTGAGKTTIINLLTRFYDIQEGSITVDGRDIRDIPLRELRDSMALVLQDTHLFTGTVRDNIRYGRLDATDAQVEAAARLANAHSFIRRLPQGYETMLTADGANLSQGQRQLLSIARAALADPPIMILDEATSSIDTRTEKLIEKGMDRLMEGRTVFVIAHRLSTVRNANAIMVLEHGEIIERGDHDDLLLQKGRYFELYTGARQLA